VTEYKQEVRNMFSSIYCKWRPECSWYPECALCIHSASIRRKDFGVFARTYMVQPSA